MVWRFQPPHVPEWNPIAHLWAWCKEKLSWQWFEIFNALFSPALVIPNLIGYKPYNLYIFRDNTPLRGVIPQVEFRMGSSRSYHEESELPWVVEMSTVVKNYVS